MSDRGGIGVQHPTTNRTLMRGSILRSQFTSYVLDQLRLKILSGELTAGSRLIEREMAETFNVSRGPIRDAFMILEQEGLVTALPRGGMEVRGLSVPDVTNFFAVRYNLEKMACESIIRRDSCELDGLKDILKNMTSTEDVKKLSQLDVSFHQEMVRLSGNSFLLRLWETLAPVVGGILELTNNLWRTDEIVEGHAELFEGLETRNSEVFQILHDHLLLPEKLMRRYLTEPSQPRKAE